jgi:hypothetical protein
MSAKGILFTVIALVVLAGCGGGAVGGDGDGGSDLPTSATASSEDEEGTVYPLAPGRYRLEWTVDGCPFPSILITDAGGAVVFEQMPRVRIIFVPDVPGGDTTITQTNPECTDWEFRLLKF